MGFVLKEGVYRITNNFRALNLTSSPPGVWELLVANLLPYAPNQEWTVRHVSSTMPWYQMFNPATGTYPTPLNNGATGFYLAGSTQPHAQRGWEIIPVPGTSSSYKVIWHTSDIPSAHLWKWDPRFPSNIWIGSEDGSDDCTWTFERVRDLDG